VTGLRGARVLVTGGRTAIALQLCRALRHAGAVVFAGDAMASSITRFSRATRGFIRLPRPADDVAAYVNAVGGAADAHRIDAVIPTGEERLWLALAHESGHRLPVRAVGAQPIDMLARLHDKLYVQSLVHAAGLTPVETHVATPSAIDAVIAAHGAAVVKPRGERFGRGVAFIERGSTVPDDLTHAVVQPRLGGEERCGFVLAHEGVVCAAAVYCPRWRFPHGPSFCFEVKDDEGDVALRAAMSTFVAHHGLSGAFGFDAFITGGDVRIIECNPRFTSGVHMLRDDVLVDALEGVSTAQATRAGAMVLPAMVCCARVDARGSLRRLARDLLRFDDVTWSWTDPLPALAAPLVVAELVAIARRDGVPARFATSRGLAWEPSVRPVSDAAARRAA